ncbi:MAG: transglutaminaseTgpA domain-containing protein [Acidimicrobiales bacterium]
MIPGIAAVATALAASFGAAITAHELGRSPVWALAYGLLLAPGTAWAIQRPARGPLRLPRHEVPLAGRTLDLTALGLIATGGLIAYAVLRTNPATTTFVILLLVCVIPLSGLWPRLGALGGSLLCSSAALLAADSLADEAVLVTGLVAASAVSLAAVARLDHDLAPRLGPVRAGRQGRVLAGAGVVFVLAMLAGVVASALFPPSGASGGASGGRALPAPARGDGRGGGSEPIAFQDALDVASARELSGRQIVLRVNAGTPSVWRTQAFDEWDGRVWRQSEEMGQVQEHYTAAHDRLVIPGLLVQQFSVEARYMDVLAAAPDPFDIRIGGSLSIDFLQTYRPDPPLGRGSRYSVSSLNSRPSVDLLRRAGATASDFESFTQIPETSDRVRTLAADITSGAPTSYDKAKAVERWLAANVRLDPAPAAVPVGEDVVDRLLFTDRSADPRRLATAMVVLLRAVGVPTRFAIGFLPGQRDLLGDDFTVRAHDAHAWVEVAFLGPGWQAFDPTGRIDEAERADAFAARLRRTLSRLAPVLVTAALLALGLALWWFLVRRRRWRALPWATRFWARLLKVGEQAGRPRRAAETPIEYGAALAASGLPDKRWRDIGEMISDATFSGREPPTTSQAWAEGVLREAVVAARRASRRERLRRMRRRAPDPHEAPG